MRMLRVLVAEAAEASNPVEQFAQLSRLISGQYAILPNPFSCAGSVYLIKLFQSSANLTIPFSVRS